MIKGRIVLFFGFFLVFILIVSCNRSGNNKTGEITAVAREQSAKPFAVVKSGEYPVWFQLTDDGPVHIETVEDSFFTCAFIPWPFALHVRFYEVNNNELYLAVNRYGFIKFTVNNNAADSLTLYHFQGTDIWKQYTIGGFIFYNDNPAALLYLDDRFLDSGAPMPSPRTWTFNMKSNTPFPINIPALELFPAEWNVDTLRLSADGYYYYRVINWLSAQPQIRMLRSINLAQGGNDVSLEAFQNSAPAEDTSYEKYTLPLLPEKYFYTGAVQLGDNIIAFWEEQEDYSIGAAGFMIISKN